MPRTEQQVKQSPCPQKASIRKGEDRYLTMCSTSHDKSFEENEPG